MAPQAVGDVMATGAAGVLWGTLKGSIAGMALLVVFLRTKEKEGPEDPEDQIDQEPQS
jgi:hypothetical protein